MRVTKSRLLQIIREEVRSAVVDQGLEDELEQEEEGLESEEDLEPEEVPLPLPPKISGVDNPAEKRKFKKAFLDAYGQEYKSMNPRPKNVPKEVRLGPEEVGVKVTPDIARKLIQDLGYEIQQEILPKEPGSCTGKGCTYIVGATNSSQPFSVVFGGSNKGEQFEAELHADLVAGSGPLGDELLASLGMTRQDIASVDPQQKPRARPLTGVIRDDGEAITDITLRTNDPDNPHVYLSIKDPAGGTFANNGIAGMFVEAENGFVPADHDLDTFVNALGIDKERVARGVTDYKLMRITPADLCSPVRVDSAQLDTETIAQYLSSALGYGYVYARRVGQSGYHIEHVRTEEDARALVGMPVSVAIVYARYCGEKRTEKSKGTRAIIDTDNGARYEVAIRNKTGFINPNQLVTSIVRYPSESIHESLMRSALRAVLLQQD